MADDQPWERTPFKITVEERHVTSGVPHDDRRCALARAVVEHYDKTRQCQVEVGVNLTKLYVYEHGTNYSWCYTHNGFKLVEDFDARKPITTPMKVTLTP